MILDEDEFWRMMREKYLTKVRAWQKDRTNTKSEPIDNRQVQ
jgi:hypothetical protein